MTAPNSHRPSSRRAARVTDGGKGSASDRRRRRQWLCETFGRPAWVSRTAVDQPLRVTYVVQCWRCSTLLTVDTVTADRHPIPGWKGGTYRRDNIKPCCLTCNVADGGRMGRGRQLSPGTVACYLCGHVGRQRWFMKCLCVERRWQCKSERACTRRRKGLGQDVRQAM